MLLRYFLAGIGVVFIAAGIVLVRSASEPVWFKTDPLDIQFQVVTGSSIRAPFTIENRERYQIQVEFPSASWPKSIGRFEDVSDRIEIAWRILRGKSTLAAGKSTRNSWYEAGDLDSRIAGYFVAPQGRYTLEAIVVAAPLELKDLPSHLQVLLNSDSMTDLGYTIALQPYFRKAGIIISVIGGAIVLLTFWVTRSKAWAA